MEEINQKLTEYEWDKLQGKVSQEKYDLLKEKHKGENEKVLEFLSKVELVKPRFGNTYWKVDTTLLLMSWFFLKISSVKDFDFLPREQISLLGIWDLQRRTSFL